MSIYPQISVMDTTISDLVMRAQKSPAEILADCFMFIVRTYPDKLESQQRGMIITLYQKAISSLPSAPPASPSPAPTVASQLASPQVAPPVLVPLQGLIDDLLDAFHVVRRDSLLKKKSLLSQLCGRVPQ